MNKVYQNKKHEKRHFQKTGMFITEKHDVHDVHAPLETSHKIIGSLRNVKQTGCHKKRNEESTLIGIDQKVNNYSLLARQATICKIMVHVKFILNNY